MKIIRQGDVALVQVSKLPEGCVLVEGQSRKIVLALGEATGHHHRIEDHAPGCAPVKGSFKKMLEAADGAISLGIGPEAAAEIAEAAIARARLYVAPTGERFLEVKETVTLLHEEHSPHAIPPGIYELPVQMEFDAALMRRVTD
jgi:hypothetical protein